jgi:Hydrolytic ATP binding site of dynein motor region
VYCLSFDCSVELDFKIIGRILSGLAQQGSWVCFRNLDHIATEVLRVVAQQLLCLQQGSVRQCADLDFEGRLIQLKFSFGLFITVKPGYAGRSNLPDNLKSVFRPVAVMLPDCRVISEVLLYSEGFKKASVLSSKATHLYSLCFELLTEQPQYDFSIRAVKAAIAATIQLKSREPDTSEETLFLRAVRDSTVPVLLEQDALLFADILSNLFPGVKVSTCFALIRFHFVLFCFIWYDLLGCVRFSFFVPRFRLPFLFPSFIRASIILFKCLSHSPVWLSGCLSIPQIPHTDNNKLQLAIEKTLDLLHLQKVPILVTKVRPSADLCT